MVVLEVFELAGQAAVLGVCQGGLEGMFEEELGVVVVIVETAELGAG